MNPIKLHYERLDQYKVRVFAVYYNSLHLEPMGTLVIEDIPEEDVPELTKYAILATS